MDRKIRTIDVVVAVDQEESHGEPVIQEGKDTRTTTQELKDSRRQEDAAKRRSKMRKGATCSRIGMILEFFLSPSRRAQF